LAGLLTAPGRQGFAEGIRLICLAFTERNCAAFGAGTTTGKDAGQRTSAVGE
jgi:hypothetical protein